MLLLTDRLDDGVRLKRDIELVRPCTVISVHHATMDTKQFRLIVCDIALDNPASVALVRVALRRHRRPHVPVLCLAHRCCYHTKMQARALGATDVLALDAPRAILLARIAALICDRRGAVDEDGPGNEIARAGALEAGLALAEILDAAERHKPISKTMVEHGSGAVVATVGTAGIRAWLDVVWKQDDTTYQHCLLVTGLAAAFALELKLPAKDQHTVAQAALVHDIGKARIPLDILYKPDKLSTGERNVLRTHAAIGHNLLVRQGGFDECILDVVRHHHEMLDGSGYPDGLREGQIIDLVRLMTICDIFAALIERRPSRSPMSSQEAFAILAGMGAKLDSDLVKAFRRVVDAM